ncbi:hypothetical protein ABTN27_21035, partial [Acinetobacter baumannii]
LAGVTDPERVRNYLQSTANLQFFEVYTLESQELANGFTAANKILQDYLSGVKKTDTTAAKKDSAIAVNKVDTSKTATLSQVAKNT